MIERQRKNTRVTTHLAWQIGLVVCFIVCRVKLVLPVNVTHLSLFIFAAIAPHALFIQNVRCIRLAIALATASSFTSSAAGQAGTSEFTQGGCRREGDSESSHHIPRPHTPPSENIPLHTKTPPADRLAVHVHVDEKSKSMHVAEFIRDALGSYVQYRVESADVIQDKKSSLLPTDAIPSEVLRRFGRGEGRAVQESAREVTTNQLSSVVDLCSNADPDSYAATPHRAHLNRVTDGVGAKVGAESSAGHTAATNSSATRGTFAVSCCLFKQVRKIERASAPSKGSVRPDARCLAVVSAGPHAAHLARLLALSAEVARLGAALQIAHN